jgi:hypothetical protein
MEQKQPKQWAQPSVRRYGTFETTTQGCDKKFGSADAFTFAGQAIVCAS